MSKHIQLGFPEGLNKQSVLEKIWAILPNKIIERRVMTSPPAVTVNASATVSGQTILAATSQAAGVTVLQTEYFTFIKGGNILPYGTDGTKSKFIRAKHLSIDNVPTKSNNTFGIVFDYIGSDIDLEFIASGGIGGVLIKIDNEYTSLTPTALANDYTAKFINISFGSTKKRTIQITCSASSFAGVIIGANDTLMPVDIQSPKTIIIGDSFTAGVGSTNDSPLLSWGSLFSDYIGWENCWIEGVSGTGYLNNGTSKLTYRQRITSDVIPYAPDVIILSGGINDTNYTTEQVYNEASLLISELRNALPNCLVIMLSPFAASGVSNITTLFNICTGLKQAANYYNIPFINMLEMELNDNPITGTLYAATATNSTTFQSNSLFPVGSTVEIDYTNDTRKKRCVIKSVTGTAAPYTYSVDKNTGQYHSSGTSIIQRGRCFWTGTGNVGATTGFGNSDLFVCSDGQHPSDLGHEAIAMFVADKIRSKINSM